MYILFIKVAESYPPDSRPRTPDGAETFLIFPLSIFLLTFILWSCVVMNSSKVPDFASYNIPLIQTPLRRIILVLIKTPLRVAGSTTVLYFILADLSTCGIDRCLSFASIGVFSLQALLIGLIFGIYRCINNESEIENRPQLEHKINNWRHTSQVILTSSAAVGIGAFLQVYSKEFINAQHLVYLFGPLSVGVVVCLLLIRRKISTLGDEFGSFEGDG